MTMPVPAAVPRPKRPTGTLADIDTTAGSTRLSTARTSMPPPGVVATGAGVDAAGWEDGVD
jgi:hypothetical protein